MAARGLYPRLMQTITKTSELESLCAKLASSSFVTVDTEFMREHTFWPELCLIQLASNDDEAIVDPLSEELDLAPFFELMKDKAVTKVFHAARQDIEIIHHLSATIPYPLFDTQIAAAVCNFGESIGYSNLVKKILDVDIDKSSRFTDWKRRPLAERQLSYALGDVTHLRDLYVHLSEQLEKNGRSHWLLEEMEILSAPATYEQHPEHAWKRLKQRARSHKSLAITMELAKWREISAQSKNVPRNRVIKDDAIYDIANQAPKDLNALSRLRTIHAGVVKSSKGEEILKAVRAAEKIDLSTLPALPKRRPPSAETVAIGDLLRVLLKTNAAKHGVAAKILATSSDLEKLAHDDDADIPALKGWRRELFGEDALALKSGKLGLVMENGSITVRRL